MALEYIQDPSLSTYYFPSATKILDHLKSSSLTSKISSQEKKIVQAVAEYFAHKTETVENLGMIVKIIWNLRGKLQDGINPKKVDDALNRDMSVGASFVALALETCASPLPIHSFAETLTVDTYCSRMWSHPMFAFPVQTVIIQHLSIHPATKDLLGNEYTLIETIAKGFSDKTVSYKEITGTVNQTIEMFYDELKLSKGGKMMLALSLIVALKDCTEKPFKANSRI